MRIGMAALVLTLVAGCATAPAVPPDARSELAPTGTLRAGMNLGNTLFTTKDAATGELRGLGVDLMRELAARLGVPLVLVAYPTPGAVADDSKSGAWDVAILAIEPTRAQTIAFSPAITDIEATYVVHGGSALRSAGQVDAPGVRIATPAKAGYELYLTRTLRSATLLRTKGSKAAFDLFNERNADAVAGLRPALLDAMNRMPGGVLLDDKFMSVNHGLGIPRGRPTAAAEAYLADFAEEMKASGFIARSIERHGVRGISAAK